MRLVSVIAILIAVVVLIASSQQPVAAFSPHRAMKARGPVSPFPIETPVPAAAAVAAEGAAPNSVASPTAPVVANKAAGVENTQRIRKQKH